MEEPVEPVLSERFQRRVREWLRLFTAVSLLIAALGPLWGESGFIVSTLLPFVHCPLLWAVLFLRSLPDPWTSRSSLYIRDNHPEIWKRLHPWGPISHNS